MCMLNFPEFSFPCTESLLNSDPRAEEPKYKCEESKWKVVGKRNTVLKDIGDTRKSPPTSVLRSSSNTAIVQKNLSSCMPSHRSWSWSRGFFAHSISTGIMQDSRWCFWKELLREADGVVTHTWPAPSLLTVWSHLPRLSLSHSGPHLLGEGLSDWADVTILCCSLCCFIFQLVWIMETIWQVSQAQEWSSRGLSLLIFNFHSECWKRWWRWWNSTVVDRIFLNAFYDLLKIHCGNFLWKPDSYLGYHQEVAQNSSS